MAAIQTPLVGIMMGSKSDLPVMQGAADTLKALGVPYELRVASAHRMPKVVAEYAETAESRGLLVIIAAAGAAAHLAGVIAASTMLPVLGVPMQSQALQGLDSLLAMVQMPGGVPVGTLAIGKAGAVNAALLAAAIVGTKHEDVRARYQGHRAALTRQAMEDAAAANSEG